MARCALRFVAGALQALCAMRESDGAGRNMERRGPCSLCCNTCGAGGCSTEAWARPPVPSTASSATHGVLRSRRQHHRAGQAAAHPAPCREGIGFSAFLVPARCCTSWGARGSVWGMAHASRRWTPLALGRDAVVSERLGCEQGALAKSQPPLVEVAPIDLAFSRLPLRSPCSAGRPFFSPLLPSTSSHGSTHDSSSCGPPARPHSTPP